MAGLRVAVIGAGNIGATVGKKWVAAGHEVTFGVHDPAGARARALRAELGEQARIGTAAEALEAGEVALLAVPAAAMDEVIRGHAALLDGKIVIDAANRIGNLASGGPLNSFAMLEAHAPGAQVFRAFNSLGWENFAEPVFQGVQADLMYCGPDGEARQVVERLIADVGLRPVRLGGGEVVGVVDSLLPLWFTMSQRGGWGRHFAFKVLSERLP